MGQTIKSGEGVTHKLFTEGKAEGEGDEGGEAKEGEGDAEKEISDDPKNLFIEQVVREKKMKFFKVPRLGSYLAVRLSYNSCLSEKAVELAIADKIECDHKREEQEAERKAMEEDAENDKNRDKDDDEEVKVLEPIKEKDLLVTEEKYAVCIDTMGQDRTLTDEEIKFAIGLVKEYSKTWQQTEENELKKDIQNKIDSAKKDREYLDAELQNIQMDEEKYIEDMLLSRDDIETDEQRDKEAKVYKLEFSSSQLTGLTVEPELDEDEKEADDKKSKDSKPPTANKKDRGKEDAKSKKEKDAKDAKNKKPEKPEPKVVKPVKIDDGEGDEEQKPKRPSTPRLEESISRWRKEILALKSAKIVRFPKIFQSIFYLLGYKREDICEVNTNKLCWKKAKEFINDGFFMNLFRYNPVGPKDSEFKTYQKINFIEKLVADIDIDAVEAYSFTFAKLLSWVKLAIEVRREDVIKRILNTRRLKAEREAAIEQENERQKDRKAFFEEEKLKWDEEMEKQREAELVITAFSFVKIWSCLAILTIHVFLGCEERKGKRARQR